MTSLHLLRCGLKSLEGCPCWRPRAQHHQFHTRLLKMQKSLRGATPFLMYTFKVNFMSSLDTSLLAKSKQTNSNNNNKNPASLQILQKASANNKGHSVHKVDSTDSHRLHTTDSKGHRALIPGTQKIVCSVQNLQRWKDWERSQRSLRKRKLAWSIWVKLYLLLCLQVTSRVHLLQAGLISSSSLQYYTPFRLCVTPLLLTSSSSPPKGWPS